MSEPQSLPTPETWRPAVPPPSLRRFSLLRQLGQALAMLGLGVVSYLLISHFLVRSVRVSGVSMVPTLHDSDRYLLNRWIFHVRSPHRTDIVVLQDPADHGFSVKRIIAVEGDSVSFKHGEVFVNGKKLAEPYLAAGTRSFPFPRTVGTFICGPGQYFVLGDNRNNSVDSRAYGPVPRRNILGLIIH